MNTNQIKHNSCLLFYLIIFTVLTITTSNESQSFCGNLITSSSQEEALLESFKSNLESLLLQSSDCINLLLAKGFYVTLEYYLDQLTFHNITFRDELLKAIDSIEKRLDMLHNKYRFGEKDYQKVMPVFQWAQSLDDVYIEVKFAHRFDSPGCLDLSNLTIEVADSVVSLSADCVSGDVPIRFDLNLELFDDINKESSVFNHNSVGRYQMTLKKHKADYWKRLLKNADEVHSNMKVWIEMKDKYEEQLKLYETKNDEEEFNKEYEKLTQEAEEDMKRRKKERRKRRRNQKKEELKTENVKSDL